jgi:predicted regulator of amino acid metabolism with ACT domain
MCLLSLRNTAGESMGFLQSFVKSGIFVGLLDSDSCRAVEISTTRLAELFAIDRRSN